MGSRLPLTLTITLGVLIAAASAATAQAKNARFTLVSTIAFASTRDRRRRCQHLGSRRDLPSAGRPPVFALQRADAPEPLPAKRTVSDGHGLLAVQRRCGTDGLPCPWGHVREYWAHKI